MKKFIFFLPLIIFIIISVFLLIYLLQKNDPNNPPSALLNKEVPKFEVKNLFDDKEVMTEENLKDNFILLNFFASWCAPCKVEHKILFKIKNDSNNLSLIGINYKDKINDAKKYLQNEGNPYSFVGLDNRGMVGLEFGVFGLPETFIINKDGLIIYKHLGPITEKIFNEEIKPLIQ
jgi:periplasmic protein thiol:disulfide oxidoreductases, DsbE subfamily